MSTGITPAPVTAVGGVLGGALPNPAFSAATELRFTTLTETVQAGAAYQLAAGDAGTIVQMTNAAANVVTVPADATVNFPVGTVIEVMQAGAGQTSIAAAAGVTINSPTGLLTIDTQNGSVILRKRAADTWDIDGRLSVPQILGIGAQAGANYGPVLTDASTMIRMTNAGANTVTVPTDATVAFPVGTVINIMQYNAGQTSIVAAGGVTVRSPSNWLKVEKQYGIVSLCKLAANEWSLEGRLSA